MKITKEHYAHMRDAMRAAAERQQGITTRTYEAEGLTAQRYRWDLMWSAKLNSWVCANIYPYANDEHLDTALRSIVIELGVN